MYLFKSVFLNSVFVESVFLLSIFVESVFSMMVGFFDRAANIYSLFLKRVLLNSVFLDAQASLAPTHVRCPSVRRSVRPSHFRISNLSASLVALREKLKREDPNYFSILGLGKIS